MFKPSLIACAMLMTFLLTCCSDDEYQQELLQENAHLKQELIARDSVISRVGFGSRILSSNLDRLSALEDSLRQGAQNNTQDSMLLEKVKDITALVTVNRSIIEDLKGGMGAENLSTKLLLDMILKLDTRVRDRERDIARLAGDLDLLDTELRSMLAEYEELEDMYATQNQGLDKYKSEVNQLKKELVVKAGMLDSKDALLNRASYFFGSKKELSNMGILKKANLFNSEINEDFDHERLNVIDIREFKDLTIPSSKVKILSDHPQASYTMKEQKDLVRLIINDPKEFWSVSKILIIQADH